MKLSIAQILSKISLNLASQTEITANLHREVENDIAESSVNKVSGGLDIDAKVGYNPTSNVPITDPTQFVTKEWVEANTTDATWGSITGNIIDQTDLQSALNSKPDYSSSTPSLKDVRIWLNGVAGENISSAKVCYLGQSNLWYVAQEGNDAHITKQIGVAVGGASTNGSLTIMIEGYITIDPNLIEGYLDVFGAVINPNVPIYLKDTGLLTVYKPISNSVYIGTAIGLSGVLAQVYLNCERSVDYGASKKESITIGENITTSDNLVYLATDGKWYKADYLDETKISTEIRFVNITASANANVESTIQGVVTLTGLTVGDRYSVGANGAIIKEGDIPDTEGILIRYIGTAKSSTELEFYPDANYYETTLVDSNPISYTNFVSNEIPNGLINGSNTIFTSNYSFTPESVEVFNNGLKQLLIDEYNTSGTTTITLVNPPLTGETITINYIKS